MTPTLKVIPRTAVEAEHRAAGLAVPETVAQRVQALQAAARQLAAEHIAALTAAIGDVAMLAEEIAAGGEAYPAGVRDLARRFADDARTRTVTMESLAGRRA